MKVFSNLIYLTGLVILIVVIITSYIVAEIIKTMKYIKENRNKLIFLAIQLSILILNIILTLVMGMTVTPAKMGNFMPNRITRLSRMVLLLIFILLYIPTYVRTRISKESQ